MIGHGDIRIGTVVPAHDRTAAVIGQLLPQGFESFQISFGARVGDFDVAGLAAAVRGALDAHAVTAADPACRVSAIGVYGNPLTSPETVADWETLIDAAPAFGCDVVAGFAGRIPGRPVPDSFSRFAAVFGPLARRAEDRGVRLAFENCEKRGTWEHGDWNIAHAPRAWDEMFAALESPAIGLPFNPFQHIIDDGNRVFTSRIIRSKNNLVTEINRSSCHQFSFRFIPVASTANNGYDLFPALLHFFNRGQHIQ
jgi:sugar phosphate isomerase/epimerase